MDHEVIVVGAGPGGATAAMALAQKGYDVLLLDRQSFPRDKICGDAVPATALDLLYTMGMEEKIKAANFYYIDKIRLVSPKGYSMHGDLQEEEHLSHSAIVPRETFDVLLQQHAIDSGATFVQAQVKEPIIENGQVTGVMARANGSVEAFRSKVVIAADGVTSAIARHVRSDEHVDHHRAVALRAYIADIEELPHEVEFFLYEEILPGYAWIFPLGEGRANIGLGMRLDTFREKNYNLKKMLQDFMEMPEIKGRLKNGGQLRGVATWQLNFGSQKNVQRAFDGALLIGDAAGFINPLTGGGISNAVISARLAAETVHQAFLKEDFTLNTLKVYEDYWRHELWRGLRRSYYLQRVLELTPFVVDWIVKRAQQSSEFAQIFMTKL
ncbi:MAG TPA: NAD(P)/FAD-dependent oxidoreductase [Candidatus Binatia bacterium]|jgi:geranylgeranyl reductase family protein|nr:NAD(P)/FAD-dependent oxidoreductase [Candidatus Binatia bacterium]